MSEQKQPQQQEDLKEYAGGWMVERKGTDAPAFLKAAYAVIGLFCVGYLIVYMNGEVDHADRGVLVKQFNDATMSSSPFMYVVALFGLIYVAAVVLFAARAMKHDEE